jgi:hypothetical protein
LDTPLADYYDTLTTPVRDRSSFSRGSKPSGAILRFGSLEGAVDTEGSGIGFRPPLMATMAVGKNSSIGALAELWDDAYWALSRAHSLDIVGYSFPIDDLELRTLIRTASRRPGEATLDDGLKLTVRNPSPEAHERARSYLGSTIKSDYQGAERWKP